MNNLPEKLREVSDSYYDTITTGSSNTWDAPILMYAAADEIERLRSEVERLSSPLHPAGMSAIDKVEFFHEQIVKIVKGYND